MVAAVLDTNILASVLASGFVRSNPQAAPVRVLDAWRAGAYTLVVSEPILAELVATLRRPYFRRRLSSAQLAAIRGLLRRQAVVTPLTVAVRGVATHLEDDLILATALSAAPPTWSPATPSSSAWAPTRVCPSSAPAPSSNASPPPPAASGA